MLLPAILLALAPTPQAAAEPANDPEKLICRRISQTGSRLAANKVCLTKAQWEERTRNDQREVEALTKNVRCPSGAEC